MNVSLASRLGEIVNARQTFKLRTSEFVAPAIAMTLLCVATFLALGADGAEASTAECKPPSDLLSDRTVLREWQPGKSEITEYASGGSYRVTRCNSEGEIVKSMQVAPVLLPDGSAPLAPVLKYERGGPFTYLSYGDPNDPKWVESFLESNVTKQVIPPSNPVPPASTAAAVSKLKRSRKGNKRLIRISADTSCTDSAFGGIQTNLSWWGRSYGWYARTTSMPAGDTTRQHVGYGKRAWNDTINSCGYGDQNNLTASYAGPTAHTPHTYADGLNVVDFGSVANVGCDGAIACTLMWAGAGGQMIETDMRMNSTLSWSHSGASSSYDIWSISAHESGHSLGLADIYGESHNFLTMYGYGILGAIRQRDLARGDVLGMRAIYPPI